MDKVMGNLLAQGSLSNTGAASDQDSSGIVLLTAASLA